MKLYSIISNSCVGFEIHRKLYPNHKYLNPLIGSCVYNDEQFLDFAERYETFKHMNMVECKHVPTFIPLPHPSIDPNHPVCTWGCLDIHWIHETNLQILNKFNTRLERGINIEPLFIMSISEMFQGRRDDLIKRFINLPHKSILVTDEPKDLELQHDQNHIIILIKNSPTQPDIINTIVTYALTSKTSLFN